VGTILSIEGLEFGYEKERLFRDISFDVQRGEFLGIIGPNASGKTTLLKLFDGLLKPWKGRITIDERSVGELGRREIAKRIAMVSQENRLNFTFTSLEMVLMGRTPYLGPLSFEGERDLEIARQSMALTDTWRLADRDINELSGGERQRVFIARALAQEPVVILLDEPTAFLDIRHQLGLLDLLGGLNEDRGMTIVVVSHDINLAAQYCCRLLLLNEGRIHHIGPPSEVVTQENIQEVYQTPVLIDQNPLTGSPRVTPVGRGQSNSSATKAQRRDMNDKTLTKEKNQ
jgi:iron complex transport system ATP-binding protein